ncbi:MAG: hypothetical protein WKG07_26775 [Hymenobacter sp.]
MALAPVTKAVQDILPKDADETGKNADLRLHQLLKACRLAMWPATSLSRMLLPPPTPTTTLPLPTSRLLDTLAGLRPRGHKALALLLDPDDFEPARLAPSAAPVGPAASH